MIVHRIWVAILLIGHSATALAAEALRPELTLRQKPGEEVVDLESLTELARAVAAKPFQPPAEAPKDFAHLTWDQMQAVVFKDNCALWKDSDAAFRVMFFHLGLYNRVPVQINELADGRSRSVTYDRKMFRYEGSGIDPSQLPSDLGFAGFRLAYQGDWTHDIAAFQGASYFRAVGASKQYGMSARGLAVDCGLQRPEEFPVFRAFWLNRPSAESKSLMLLALLDSASVSGAYRFKIAPGEPLTMDVDAKLFPRKAIERLGVAPLTSMYLCGENDRRVARDYRPEIHDSDGLQIWTGAGEWIWRPLVNSPVLRVNAFADDNPRGFGLMQRDRNFDHYQDDGVFYDRRPSVWVEPLSNVEGQGWGRGSVQLVEIPTTDETFDNIVAFWVPEQPVAQGRELQLRYRLCWGEKMPVAPQRAIAVATRTGIGGVIGQPRKYFSWRFAVDFSGGQLARLAADADVEPVVSASRGKIELTSARPLEAISGRRAMFDVVPPDDSQEPIDLRLYLRRKGHALTETWLYQWTPPAPADRKL